MHEKSIKGFIQTEMKSLTVPMMMLVLGLLFIILKAGILDVLVIIIGVLMIVGGVALGIILITKMDPLTVIAAAILVLVGIICVTNAFGVSKFVLTVIGVCILVNALMRIFIERTMRGNDSFKRYMINDLFTAVLGVVMILVPRDAADAVFVILGIVMMILGVSNIVSAYSFYKNGRYVNDGTDVVWEDRPGRIERIDKKD